MIHSIINHSFTRFIVVGLINTAVYYIIYLILLNWFPYIISHMSAFLCAFIFSYFLNCYFVYRVKPSIKTFAQFPLTQIVNMGLQTLLLYVFVKYIHIAEGFAPMPALLITVPITYIISKYIFTKESL